MSDKKPDHLSIGSGKPTFYPADGADSTLLERFKNPYIERLGSLKSAIVHGSVHIEVPEFTSLCPMTGQPDFATIVIDYVPGEWCVESKSLKLYMFSFRGQAEFHEACTARIARDLFDLLKPVELRVEGQFTPRGGIPFWPVVHIGPQAPHQSKAGRYCGTCNRSPDTYADCVRDDCPIRLRARL